MAPALRFLPAWVLYIYVKRDDSGDDEGATISCDPNLAYRRFTLTVYDAYFSYDDSYRRQCCMHEAIHGITAGVIRWVDDRLLTPIASINTEIYGLLRKEWIERLESMTEELTAIFERELHGKEPDPWPQPAPVKYQPASDTP